MGGIIGEDRDDGNMHSTRYRLEHMEAHMGTHFEPMFVISALFSKTPHIPSSSITYLCA